MTVFPQDTLDHIVKLVGKPIFPHLGKEGMKPVTLPNEGRLFENKAIKSRTHPVKGEEISVAANCERIDAPREEGRR